MSETGTILEVREFCLHDGPGIRTTVFFKGCPLRCAWCHNPEGISPEPQLLANRSACTGCGACERACPLGGSAQPSPPFRRAGGEAAPGRLRADDRGAASTEKDALFRPAACTACGACAPVCPQGCRRVCGRRVTADALSAELRTSDTFFKTYGGGISFSGGEPIAQIDFLEALADRLRPVHLALETSGYAPLRNYRRAIQAVDFVYQDLKHPDPAEHRRFTGVDPQPIFENLAWLKASGRPFTARIPLIPGVNDAPETLAGFAELLQGPSGLEGVELLPYHLTAGAKYAALGVPYEPPFDPLRAPRPDPSAFLARGLPCRVM
jgi:pyruvate formate lyase activating enzyme